jgi:hypothetical protein
LNRGNQDYLLLLSSLPTLVLSGLVRPYLYRSGLADEQTPSLPYLPTPLREIRLYYLLSTHCQPQTTATLYHSSMSLSTRESASRRDRQRHTTSELLSSVSLFARYQDCTDDRFLIGDSEGAKTDLEKSLDILPSFVQSWVKIASVHMELGKLKKADCRRKLTSRRPS